MKIRPEVCKRGHLWDEKNTRYQTHKNRKPQRYCYECKLESARDRMLQLKIDAVNKYGGWCVCCKENILDFLAIDHINNDGAEHRKTENIQTGWGTYYWLKRNGYPEGFQVLCHNCNWAKHMHGRCPYHENF